MTADIGGGKKQKVLYPPKAFVGVELEFKDLVHMMKTYHVIPALVDNEVMFVSWDEMRLFFGARLDQFLVDVFDLIPLDVELEGEDND